METKKILFIAEGQLGDLLLLTPAIKVVKKTFPQTSISLLIIQRRNNNFSIEKINTIEDILIDNSNNPLIDNPNVDEIYVINHNAMRALKGLKKITLEFQVIKFIRQKNFNTVICTFPHDRFILWAFVSGAKIRIGQSSQSFSFLLTHKINIKKEDVGVLNYYLEMVKSIGTKPDSNKTEFYIDKKSEDWFEQFAIDNSLHNKKLIAIHPGASGDYKIWPPENYAQLIQGLSEKENAKIILCYGEGDSIVIDLIKNNLQKDVETKLVFVNADNDLNKLAEVFQNCNLTITNDSGPRHLSAALNIPNLTLFRKFHDRAWKVYPENNFTATIQSTKECEFCNKGECNNKIPEGEIFGSYCMREISVDKVYDKILNMLNKTKKFI